MCVPFLLVNLGCGGRLDRKNIKALYCRFVTSAFLCPFSIAMSLLMQVSKLSEYFIRSYLVWCFSVVWSMGY